MRLRRPLVLALACAALAALPTVVAIGCTSSGEAVAGGGFVDALSRDDDDAGPGRLLPAPGSLAEDASTCRTLVGFGERICDECFRAKCCAVVNRCYYLEADGAPSECWRFVDCISGCMTDAGDASTVRECKLACEVGHDAAVVAQSAARKCVIAECGAVCPTS